MATFSLIYRQVKPLDSSNPLFLVPPNARRHEGQQHRFHNVELIVYVSGELFVRQLSHRLYQSRIRGSLGTIQLHVHVIQPPNQAQSHLARSIHPIPLAASGAGTTARIFAVNMGRSYFQPKQSFSSAMLPLPTSDRPPAYPLAGARSNPGRPRWPLPAP